MSKKLKMSSEIEILENALKNDLIDWLNKNHNNKGEKLTNALEIVNENTWNDLCKYSKEDWSLFVGSLSFGTLIFIEINQLKSKNLLEKNEKSLLKIDKNFNLTNSKLIEDADHKEELIRSIIEDETNPNDEPYKENTIQQIKGKLWDTLCEITEEQWIKLTTLGLGISIFNKINRLKSKKGF